MIAGRLEIEMMAQLARLSKDMQEAKRIVGGATKEIERMAGSAKNVLAMLGIGASLAYFTSIVKGAIDANDHLNDLNKTTSITVENLAGLRFASQQTGAQLDGTAAAINKLAQNMGKDAEKFRALGITAKDPIEAFKQLSDIFVAIQDPQRRAAVMADALGKSWQGAAPLLSEGSARIAQMVSEGAKLSGVTQQIVEPSDEFNDKLVMLTTNGGAWTAVLNRILPLLNATADGMIEAGKGTTVWSTMGGVLAEVLRVVIVLGGNVAFVLRGIVAEVTGIVTQLGALMHGDLEAVANIGAQMKTDAASARKAFDEWEKGIMAVGTAANATKKAVAGMTEEQYEAARIADEASKVFLAGEEAKKKALKDAADAAKKAKEERDLRAKAELDAEEMFAKDYLEAWQAVYDQRTKEALAAAKIRLDAAEAEAKAEEMFAQDNAEAWEAYNQFLKKQGEERQAQTEQQMSLWSQFGDVAGDFFADLVMNGKSAFDNLKRWAKELLAQMIALFAKRWILNLAAGGTVMGAAGQALGASSDGSMAGNVISTGASLMGAGGSLGIGGASLGASMWGAMGAGTAVTETGVVLATGSMAGTSIGTGVMSGVYSALAAIPVWGWIAMAVIAIGAWIAGNHKGGPKVGGSFMGGFDSSGAFTGSSAVPGSDNGRFYTPSQGDAGMEQLVRGVGHGYAAALRQFGGTSAGMQFGLGFDHDPAGTAQSRVSSMVRDSSGRVVYRQQDMNMDDKEVTAALQLETQRMIIAALQASELPEGVAQIIRSLDVENATAEQINAALGLASAYQRLGDTIAAIEGGPVVALEQQLRGMKDAVDGAQIGLAEAIAGGDHQQILAAEQALEQAIINRYNTELEMIRNLQAAIRATEQAAYSFAMNMAQRINAVGGSVDVAALAMGRATTLRGRVGGNAPVAHQLEDVQEYVGAIDSWYQARRAQIEAQATAEMQAQQAINQAQAATWSARAAQLQAELAITQQFQGIVDRTRQMLEQMRFTALNPAGATARLGMVEDDLGGLRGAYEGATGAARVTGANRLLDALQTRLGLLGEVFQRPSPEYQAGYNEIIAEITRLQGEAMTEAERGLVLQERIAEAQQMASMYASMTAAASEASRVALEALDAEARGYYTWARAEGERLFGVQRQEQETLVNTITGGREPNLYTAQRTAEMVEELRGLRDDLRNGFSPPEVTVNVTVDGDGDVSTQTIVDAVKRAAPTIKRVLATA